MIELCSLEKYRENINAAKKLFPFLEISKDSYGRELKKEEALFSNFSEDVLVIYGISPVLYLKLEKYLKNKTLIFLEDEVENFTCFLQTNIAEKMLSDKRVQIYFLENEGYIFKKIAWENVLLKIKILPSYFYSKKKRFLEIESKLNEMVTGAFLSFSNYQDFGKLHFQNTFQNLLYLKDLKLISSLKKSFQNIPAVICGAGPSLEKALPILHEMKDRSFIFAGGTALNILSKNNIIPHFSAAIDKEAEDRFKKNTLFETVFLHPGQVSFNNLKSVQGEKILVQNDLTGLEKYLFNELSLQEESLDTGWTVGTFLIATAHFLGCSPIYFTGLDFCFAEKKYANGSGVDKNSNDFIEARDIFGKKVFTQKDWLLAVKWIEDFGLKNKNVLVNANHGGIKILNVPEGEIASSLKNFDTSGFLHNKVQSIKKIEKADEKVLFLLQEIEKSALSSENICNQLLAKLEKDFNNKSFSEYSLEEFEKELFFEYHLLPLWNIYSYVIKRNIEENEMIPAHFLYFLNKILFFKKVIEDYLTLGPLWKNMK